MDVIKTLSVDLIADLNEIYPAPTAEKLLVLNDRDLGFLLGQRAVVEFLNTRLEQGMADDVRS